MNWATRRYLKKIQERADANQPGVLSNPREVARGLAKAEKGKRGKGDGENLPNEPRTTNNKQS